jgi:hypothetical protein
MPSTALPFIEDELDDFLSNYEVPVGVCSLAAGADQLFARTIIGHHGELQVVIPSRGYEATFVDDTDRQQYLRLLEKATRLIELDIAAPSEEAYFAAGQRVVEMCDHLVAIWDGEVARGLGGTADVVSYARELGRPLTVIWPGGVTRT